MDPENCVPEIQERIAKNIILSKGGCLYPNSEDLTMEVMNRNGEISKRKVSSIHFSPGWPDGGCYIHFIGGDAILKDEEDRQKVYQFVVKNWPFTDKYVITREALETRLRLRERNIAFIARHGDLDEDDIEMIEEYQKAFESQRERIKDNPVPLPGDIVEGTYYNGANSFTDGLIESHPHYKKPYSVCAHPYVPFIHFRDKEKDTIGMSVSGGPFFGLDAEDLEYVGPDTRYACDWGHCGCCAGGALDFPVKVNRWRIKEGVNIL